MSYTVTNDIYIYIIHIYHTYTYIHMHIHTCIQYNLKPQCMWKNILSGYYPHTPRLKDILCLYLTIYTSGRVSKSCKSDLHS